MASIITDDNYLTQSSFRVGISGLTGISHNGPRKAYWYMKEGRGCSDNNYDKGPSIKNIADGVSTGAWADYSGLSAGTLYSVYVEILDTGVGGNAVLFTDYDEITTEDIPQLTDPEISSFRVTDIDKEGKEFTITYSISDPDDAGWSMDIYVNDEDVAGEGTYAGSSSGYGDISGREATYGVYENKLYYVSAVLVNRNSSDICDETGTKEADFSLPKPQISNFRATSHSGQMSATFYWSTSDVQSGNYLRLWLKHSDDSGYSYVSPSVSSTSYDYSFSRTGTYYAHIVLYNRSGDELSRSPDRGDITVESTYSITDFDWTSSELSAFNNNGDIKNLTRERWNSFLDYVNRCVDYYNAKNGTSYSKLSSSVRMGTDRIMYASSFKAVCQKINDITQATMSGITLSQIVKGNPIKGSYFPYMLQFLKDRM